MGVGVRVGVYVGVGLGVGVGVVVGVGVGVGVGEGVGVSVSVPVLTGGAVAAGSLLSAAGLSGLVGAPVGGWLSDRMGARFTTISAGVFTTRVQPASSSTEELSVGPAAPP
eukprot:6351302-Prymnesium_polylepis.1